MSLIAQAATKFYTGEKGSVLELEFEQNQHFSIPKYRKRKTIE